MELVRWVRLLTRGRVLVRVLISLVELVKIGEEGGDMAERNQGRRRWRCWFDMVKRPGVVFLYILEWAGCKFGPRRVCGGLWSNILKGSFVLYEI